MRFSPSLLHYSSAAMIAAAWAALAETIGPGSLELLIPVPAALVGALVGAALAPPLADRLFPLASKLVSAGLLKKSPFDVSRELSTHFSMGSATAAAFLVSAAAFAVNYSEMTPLIGLGLIPLVIMGAYYIALWNSIAERKERVDWELPFFAVFTSILTRCGLSLYAAMDLLTRRGGERMFKQMSREAKEVKRMVELAGRGVVDSLDAHALNHPHRQFQTFFLSATAVWRTGGDVASAIEDRAAELLKSIEEKFDSFATTIGTIIEAIIILLLLLPLGIALVAIAAPWSQVAVMVNVIELGLIPGMSIVFYAVVKYKSPKELNYIPVRVGNVVPAIAAGATAVTIGTFLQLSPTYLYCLGAAFASIAFNLTMMKTIRELDDCEGEVRRWLRDVSELRRLGYTPGDALSRTRNNRYRPGFASVLNSIASRVMLGMSIWEAAASAKSWLLRVIAFLLHAINVSGGGSPELMERLNELLRGYSLAKEKTASKLAPFKFLTYLMPVIAGFMLAMVLPLPSMLASVGGQPLGLMGSMSTISPETMKQMTDSCMLMIAVAVTAAMFVINKALDGHPFKTYRIAVVTLIAAAVYAAIDPLSSLIIEHLIGGVLG